MAGLPEGFTIDQPQAGGGLPEGFSIDQPAAAGPSWSDRAMGAIDTAQGVLSKASGLPVVGPIAGGLSKIDPRLVGEAVSNVPKSAVEFAKNTVEPFIHPIETIQNVGDAGSGLAHKLGVGIGERNEADIAKADAVGKFFADRYGGMENLKRTVATDPVGFLGDLSLVLTGGGSAAARLPGVAGRVGEVAGAVGRTVDPLNAVTAAGRGAGRVASEVAGVTTGAGGTALQLAAKAGAEGGDAARAFRENITSAAPAAEVVDDMRAAVSKMRQERGNLYRQEMAKIGADKTIMSWNDVDTALADMNKVATYKGQSLSPSTEAIRDRIVGTIDEWKNLRASEFWTPEGFDALKRKVGDIRDATQYGTPERRVADQAYNSIKKTIVDQAPEYARVMKGYEEASNMIREIERTLAAKPGASVDTSLRRLQSILRNNVNTNYGRRAELAEYLVNAGAPHLMEKLAGQALNAWMPRGLARVTGPLTTAGAGFASLPAAIPAAAAASPRLMGEVAYGLGKASRLGRPAKRILESSRQVGRLSNIANIADRKEH